jgi:hypothetical protein
MTIATKTDLGTDSWMIDDGIIRLREWGSGRCHELPDAADAQLTLGSSETCSLRLIDPSGRLSRQHAQLAREGTRWIARDLDSKNGLRLDGVRRPKVALEPGSELGLGGVTLIAESPRLIALRGFLARILGWSSDRGETVDLAVRAVRLAATRRAALALCGDGDLVPIAYGLHRYSLGIDRPFVLCDPRRRASDPGVELENHAAGMRALQAAAGGTMCVWPRRLPGDYAELTAALHRPSTQVQLIACGPRPSDRTQLVAAPIEIPPLAARPGEVDRIIDEYARDAAAALEISTPMLSIDRGWVRKHCGTSLVEIEKGASRILALRRTGSIAGAAAMLGMAHASLGEWVGRRRLPPGTLNRR